MFLMLIASFALYKNSSNYPQNNISSFCLYIVIDIMLSVPEDLHICREAIYKPADFLLRDYQFDIPWRISSWESS